MAPSFSENINKAGVRLYEDWAKRLGQASYFPDLSNSPALEYIGKGIKPLVQNLESIYEYVNPEDTSTGIQEYLRGQNASRSTDLGLIQRINAFSDSFLNRQNQLLNIGQNGGTSFADGGFNTVQNLAERLEALTGKPIFEGLNSSKVNELSVEHELLGHLGPKETGFIPDNRRLVYPEGVIQTGPFLPANELLAQTLNQIQAKGKVGFSEISSKYRHQLDTGSLSNNKAMLATVLDALKNKGIEITESLKDRIANYHAKATGPWVAEQALNKYDELGIDDFLKQKLQEPMYRRIKNLSDMQLYDPASSGSAISLDMPGFPKWDRNAGGFLSRFEDFRKYDMANSRMRNFDHTITQLRNLYQAANQGSMNNAPGIFDMSGVGNRLLAADPVGAALAGAKDLITQKPGVVTAGALSGINSKDSKNAALEGDWNKVAGNVAFSTGKELITDAAVQRAMQWLTKPGTEAVRAGAFRLPWLGRAAQTLGPAMQRLAPLGTAAAQNAIPAMVGKNIFELGAPNGVLQTLLTEAGNAWDSALNKNPNLARILPRSNTGYDDDTGRTASQYDLGKQAGDAISKAVQKTGNELGDVAEAAYSQIDTLFGGALPGGVDPRFNGFNATRDLTAAQQLDYRRGGGDAARRQNPGLTPQQVIEQGRQAVAAATRAQQNNTTAPTGRPANTRPTPGQTGNLDGNRGSNIGRPANTRPSASASGTPVSRPGSRVVPRRTGQNSTVIDIGKVVNYWGNRIFNWR